MRYAMIVPRSVPARITPVVSQAVVEAREELRQVMKTGTPQQVDKAYEHLENVDRTAKARRASAHAIRIVERVLPITVREMAAVNPDRK
jgi:transketolase